MVGPVSKTQNVPVFIPGDTLRAFSDLVYFRDPKARSRQPSLIQGEKNGRSGLLFIGDRLLLHHEFRVSKKQGIKFVDTTGDDNKIHREDDIVSGALTAAKILLPIEMMFPEMAITMLEIKFQGFAHYDRRTLILSEITRADDDRLIIKSRVEQEGNPIATARIRGTLLEKAPIPYIPRRKVNIEELRMVRDFFASLGVASKTYFKKPEGSDFTYPLSYIASLPSGVMVEKLRGQGGLLNKLRLEFNNGEKIPITSKIGPEIDVQKANVRNSMSRVVASIREGIKTYYQGWALVSPKN